MAKITAHRKFIPCLIGVILGITTTAGMLTPRPVEAFDAFSAIFGIGAQYVYLNKQIDYINNDEKGRTEYLEQIKKDVGVNHDPLANSILDNVMTRLSDAIAITDPSIREKPYNYFVNNQKTFNAFCTLGHNLSVNIGLFDMLNYNEDEIALVVGHEMGHGQNNDPANGIKKSLPLNVLAALYQSQNADSISIISANVLANIGNAKNVTYPMEKNADEEAFQYTQAAGYNVGAGAATWQRVLEKMGENNTNFVSEMFNPSDHPGNVARRDNYNAKITEYSNNKIKVNNESGLITLNSKTFCIPAAIPSMSTLERAYLIAGNLAEVYHSKNIGEPLAYVNGNQIWVNDTAIMNITANDNAYEIIANFNTAKKFAPAPQKNITTTTTIVESTPATTGYFRQKVDAAYGRK